jgi:hypothetical protein
MFRLKSIPLTVLFLVVFCASGLFAKDTGAEKQEIKVAGHSEKSHSQKAGIGGTIDGIFNSLGTTVNGLGRALDDTANGLGKTIDKTMKGIGKGLNETAKGLGEFLEGTGEVALEVAEVAVEVAIVAGVVFLYIAADDYTYHHGHHGRYHHGCGHKGH